MRVSVDQSVNPLQLSIKDHVDPLLLLPSICIVRGMRAVSKPLRPLNFMPVKTNDAGPVICK